MIDHLENARKALEREKRSGRDGPTLENIVEALREMLSYLEDVKKQQGPSR